MELEIPKLRTKSNRSNAPVQRTFVRLQRYYSAQVAYTQQKTTGEELVFFLVDEYPGTPRYILSHYHIASCNTRIYPVPKEFAGRQVILDSNPHVVSWAKNKRIPTHTPRRYTKS